MQSLPDARAFAHPISVTSNEKYPSDVVRTNRQIREHVPSLSLKRKGISEKNLDGFVRSKDRIRDNVSTGLSIETGDRAESPEAKAAPSADAAGGEAPGLVHSQTSGTSPLSAVQRAALAKSFGRVREREKAAADAAIGGAKQIDPEATRLKRLKCSVLTAARLHEAQKAKWRVAMLTLTYRPDVDWESGQISALVRHIRQYLARCGVAMRHVWVQEFTKKGKPHYHMLLWLPLGRTIPKPDKRGWWPFGFTKIEWARNAVGYIAKYASKGDSLHKPAKGARMHGNGGLTGDCLLEQRWWKLPGWMRDKAKPSDAIRRAPNGTGGGFVHPETGERFESPYEVFFSGGKVYYRVKGAK